MEIQPEQTPDTKPPSVHFSLPSSRHPSHISDSAKPQVSRGARACTVCRAAKVNLVIAPHSHASLILVPR